MGDEISSKLIPAKDFSKSCTVRINSSLSLVSITIGIASILPNLLYKADFPSITGIDAAGPMSPNPRTRVPSEITATTLPRQVNVKDKSSSSLIAKQGAETHGVYTVARS